MTLDCGFDSQSGLVGDSDCMETCVAAGCGFAFLMGNSVCEEMCGKEVCGWDGGDCVRAI